MNLEIKEAFEKVIGKFHKNKDLYNYYPRTYSHDREKFTVLGLSDLACNHLFDDHPELFGINKEQGHAIRAYFHNLKQHEYIIELYKEFPKVFAGEAKHKIFYEDKIEELVKNKVPLF